MSGTLGALLSGIKQSINIYVVKQSVPIQLQDNITFYIFKNIFIFSYRIINWINCDKLILFFQLFAFP